MRPDPTILAFDTSAAHCAAALLKDGAICGDRSDPMAKGQAEYLMPMLQSLLGSQDSAYTDLDAIAVGIGPGNFTGTRISVSAARGLALALGIPAIGVSNFEVMCDPDNLTAIPDEIICLAGPRDTAYVQHFRHGKPQEAPLQIDPANPPDTLNIENMQVRGFRAADIARPFNAAFQDRELADIAPRIARRGEWRLGQQPGNPPRPVPLYVRAADAAPPRDPAPVILI